MNDGLNRVILLGNLGAEPELRFTASGTAVLNFRLATNETFLDRNKEAQARTDWHQVVVWGTRAEALAKLLCKGSLVLVEGGLRTSSFEKDGVRRTKTEIHAREVSLVGGRRPTPPGDAAEMVLDEEPLPRPPATGTGTGPRSVVALKAAVGARTVRPEPMEELPY